MTPKQLRAKLNELLALPAETECVEFKEAKNNYDFNALGKYFWALSNEANLKGQKNGWLVLGVQGKPRAVVGTNYRRDRPSLDRLKQEVAEGTTNRITFNEIHGLELSEGRVLMFEIPPALRGVPTAWKGHYFGREGEALAPLSLNEIELIRGQATREDWSATICGKATLADLDPDAIRFARRQYLQKHRRQAGEIDKWDDLAFLNKAKVCISGGITNAAVLLLGREESASLLSPSVAQIAWVLKDERGNDQDYAHFHPPILLAVDQVLKKLRILALRHMPSGTLFPTEISQYDTWVIREALHNCIAHQDYSLGGRVNLVEFPESLLFTNLGQFIPGSVEHAIRHDAPPEQYRNPFLAQAMVNLNMIDTIGSGIRRMFTLQQERCFPLPDYKIDSQRVEVRLFGAILDENYTQLLIEKADLDLMDVIALDKVQKKRPLTEEEFRRVKRQRLIEGRRPNLYVSAKIAALTGDKAAYIKNRAFDKEHYKKMVVSYLEKFGRVKRGDIDRLVMDKLSDTLDDKQKRYFVTNLLQEMKRAGTIRPEGVTRGARWVLCRTSREDGD